MTQRSPSATVATSAPFRHYRRLAVQGLGAQVQTPPKPTTCQQCLTKAAAVICPTCKTPRPWFAKVKPVQS